MNQINPVTVLIADDQIYLNKSYAAIIEGAGMQLVGVSTNTTDVLPLYKEHKPNVVLLDIRFGETRTGFDVMEEILQFDKSANIVVCSQHIDPAYIQRFYAMGGKSFLTKNTHHDLILTAIKAASIGRSYHIPDVTAIIMDNLGKTDPDPVALLQPNDFKIFMMIAEGKTNLEIVESTTMNIGFVSTHRQKIQDILKIDRPQQFTRLAIRLGLMEP